MRLVLTGSVGKVSLFRKAFVVLVVHAVVCTGLLHIQSQFLFQYTFVVNHSLVDNLA